MISPLSALRSPLVLAISFLFQVSIQAQSVPFFEVLPPSASLTSEEQDIFNKYQNDSLTVATWKMQVNPIQNYLNGSVLQITLPTIDTPVVFFADGVISNGLDNYYWSGTNSGGSSISINRSPDGYLGTIVIAPQGRAFSITSLSSQKSILIERNPADYPNSGCDEEIDEDDLEEIETVSDRSGCGEKKIRILFLHSPSAALEPSFSLSFPSLVINQLNTACAASGLSSTDIWFESVLPNSMLLPEFTQGVVATGTARRLKNNNLAQQWRDYYHADIVCLFCGTFSNGGATGAIKRDGWVVAQNAQVDHYFKMAHGVGHVVIGNATLGNPQDGHQLCRNCCHKQCAQHCPQFDGNDCGKIILPNCHYDHAWKINENYRTIMADCGESEFVPRRVARWSSSTVTFPIYTYNYYAPSPYTLTSYNVPMGDADSDNARVLKENAGNIACLRSGNGPISDPIPNNCNSFFQITGPTCLGSGTYATFYATSTASTITWEKSNDGITFESLGTGASISVYITYPSQSTLYLRAKDDAGNCGKFQQQITNCFEDNGVDRSKASLSVFEGISVYPNPAVSAIRINGVIEDAGYAFYDINGVQKTPYSELSDGLADASHLPNGIFFLRIKAKNETKTFKIVKQ